jgi:hypothetical protein
VEPDHNFISLFLSAPLGAMIGVFSGSAPKGAVREKQHLALLSAGVNA